MIGSKLKKQKSSFTDFQLPPWLHGFAPGILVLLLAAFSCWRVFEDDIYMQIRAGQEILALHTVPSVDSWSFTIPGHEWINYNWLSMVSFATVYKLFQEEGLVWMRAFSVLIWLLAAWSLVTAVSNGEDGESKNESTLGLILALPLFYLLCSPRIQLRPEFLGFPIFLCILAIWSNPRLQALKYRLTPLLILLWSNLHGGTAIFGLILAKAFLAHDFLTARQCVPRKKIAATAALVAMAFFLTPIGYKIIPALLEHFSYDTNLVWNSEWESFSWKSLPFSKFTQTGGLPWLQLLYLLICWGTLLFSWKETKSQWPVIYRDWRVSFPMALLLTLMSFDRVRVLPYAVMFFLPVFIFFLQSLYRERKILVIASVSVIVGASTVFQFHQSLPRLGFAINDVVFPEELFDFIRREKPKAPMFSSFAVANYQLLSLPQYPVFIDPRDIIFNDVKPDYRSAFSHPDGMKSLLKKYSINTAFIEMPKKTKNANGQLINALPYFFPPEDWALVAFSDQKAVFVRRLTEHEDLIRRNEFKRLQPCLPPQASLDGIESNPVLRDQVRSEASRCLGLSPQNVFCQVVMAGVESLAESPSLKAQALEKAMARLESALECSEQRSEVDHAYLLEMLESIATQAGDLDRADEIHEKRVSN